MVDTSQTFVVIQTSNSAMYRWVGENDQRYSAELQAYSDGVPLYSVHTHTLSSADVGVSGTWTTAYTTSIIKLT